MLFRGAHSPQTLQARLVMQRSCKIQFVCLEITPNSFCHRTLGLQINIPELHGSQVCLEAGGWHSGCNGNSAGRISLRTRVYCLCKSFLSPLLPLTFSSWCHLSPLQTFSQMRVEGRAHRQRSAQFQPLPLCRFLETLSGRNRKEYKWAATFWEMKPLKQLSYMLIRTNFESDWCEPTFRLCILLFT